MQTTHVPPKPENKLPRPSSIYLDGLSPDDQKKFLRAVVFGKIPSAHPAVDEAMRLRHWPRALRPSDPTELLVAFLSEQPPAWLDDHRDLFEGLMGQLLVLNGETRDESALICLKSLVAHSRAGLGTAFLKKKLDVGGLSKPDELDLYLIWAKIEERRSDELGGSALPDHEWVFSLGEKPHLAAFRLYLNREKNPLNGLWEVVYCLERSPEDWEMMYIEPYLRRSLAVLFDQPGHFGAHRFKALRAHPQVQDWLAGLLDEALAHPSLADVWAEHLEFLDNEGSQKLANPGQEAFEQMTNVAVGSD